MKFHAHVLLSFKQSGNKKQLNKCIILITITKKECWISFVKNDNSKRIEYKLTKNIGDIRTKFINEGKITLQLNSPEVYIFISQASFSDLEKAVQLFVNISNNKDISVDIPKQSQIISEKDKELLQTTLTIGKISQFPVSKGYPSNLQTLSLMGLKMKKFDNRILRLRSLCVLNLENLLIEEIPTSLQSLTLTSLTIISCKLNKWPSIQPDSPLAKSLIVLNLSNNQLSHLPDDFWVSLPNVRSVFLNGNALQALPAVFLDRLIYIQRLDLSDNRLSVLPYAFTSIGRQLIQCNLTSAFIESTLPERYIGPRKFPFQPNSLLQSSILTLSQALSFHRSFISYQSLLPVHLWLQLGVLRCCFVCQRRVSPSSWRSWAPLHSVSKFSFGIEVGSINPVIVYYCDGCRPIETPANEDTTEPMDHS